MDFTFESVDAFTTVEGCLARLRYAVDEWYRTGTPDHPRDPNVVAKDLNTAVWSLLTTVHAFTLPTDGLTNLERERWMLPTLTWTSEEVLWEFLGMKAAIEGRELDQVKASMEMILYRLEIGEELLEGWRPDLASDALACADEAVVDLLWNSLTPATPKPKPPDQMSL